MTSREKAIELLLEDIKDLGNRLSAVDQWPVQRKQIRAIIDKSTQALAALEKSAVEPDKISEAIELLERAIEILDTMDSMEDNPIEICCNTEALKGIIPEALALLKPAVCKLCKGSGIIKPEGAPRSNQQALPYLQLCPDCKPAGSGQAEAGEFDKEELRKILAEENREQHPFIAIEIVQEALAHIDRLGADLKDIELELSTPETMICAQEKEPLYKRAATIVCRKIELEAESKRLKEAIIAAIELLEIGIRNAKTGIPLWESVGDVQEILDQALQGQKEEEV